MRFWRYLAATGHRAPSNWKGGRIPDGKLLEPVLFLTGMVRAANGASDGVFLRAQSAAA